MQKLEIYKKIANISGNDDYYDIQEEIEDRYGNIPKSVQYLLEIALIKNRAHNLDIISVVQKPKSVLISFRGDADIDPAKITAAVIKKPLKYMFTAATNPYITVKINENDKKEVLNIIDEALSDIESAQWKSGDLILSKLKLIFITLISFILCFACFYWL